MEPAKVTIEELSPVRKRLQVEVSAKDVRAELDRHFSQLGDRSRIRGFRPGKAPRAVLEKMFGDQVRREVVSQLVEETFYSAVESNHLDVVGTPEIEADDLTDGGALIYKATVDVRPDLQLADVSGLEVERPAAVVTDEQVEQVVNSLRDHAATLLPIEDRAVVEGGDIVTVDLSSRMDGGQPVRRADVMLEAGAGSFPQALERQIVGHHKGARLNVTVPYPDDYGNPQLAGKSAEFEIDIRDLRQKQLPTLDDDFARDHGRCESLTELRTKIRADLEHRAAHQADAAVRDALLGKIVEMHTFDVPPSMLARRTEYLLASLDLRLPEGPQGEELASRLRGELEPRAEREVRAELLLDAIAQRDGIAATDDEVTAEIDAMAQREQQAPERLRAFYDRPEARAALKARIIRERTLEHVVAGARIVPGRTENEVARA